MDGAMRTPRRTRRRTARRGRSGAVPEQAPPHPVRVSVAMKRAHAEMSSAATVGLLLGHGASVTASTNGNPSEARPSKKAKTTPQAPAGK